MTRKAISHSKIVEFCLYQCLKFRNRHCETTFHFLQLFCINARCKVDTKLLMHSTRLSYFFCHLVKLFCISAFAKEIIWAKLFESTVLCKRYFHCEKKQIDETPCTGASLAQVQRVQLHPLIFKKTQIASINFPKTPKKILKSLCFLLD